MDEPVALWNYPPRSREEPHCIVEALENVREFDDKDEFLKLIKLPEFQIYREAYDPLEIFEWDALNCCIAVLNGETKGIIDIEDVLDQGFTPLHLAALNNSVKLTKYILGRGDSVDVHSDLPFCNLKQGTPIDFVIEGLASGHFCRRWIHRKSVYELLVVLCCNRRDELETLRMLVRNTQNKERVRQTFMDYADKRNLVAVALLFLAAPELFLSSASSSSIAKLYHVFNSLEKRTDIEEAMLLLVDALAILGHKLVAYTRLEYPNEQAYERSFLDVAFLVREVARNKQGLSSPDDYFLSFFKPVRPEPDQLIDIPEHVSIRWWQDWQHKGNSKFVSALPIQLKRHDLDQGYINRVLPSLKTEDADRLNNAIEKKLSSMPTLYGPLEDFIKTPKRGVKFPLQGFPFPFSTSLGSSLRSLTHTASAKCGLDLMNTPTNSWRNKVMKSTKLNSLFSWASLSQFSNIAKRLIK